MSFEQSSFGRKYSTQRSRFVTEQFVNVGSVDSTPLAGNDRSDLHIQRKGALKFCKVSGTLSGLAYGLD